MTPRVPYATLLVQDVVRSADWYVRVAGFTPGFVLDGPDGTPALVQVTWPPFGELMLAQGEEPGPVGQGVMLTFPLVRGSVDELAERARTFGTPLVQEPVDQPWDAREVTVLDPDGYRLTFSQTLEDEPTIESERAGDGRN